MSTPIVAFTDPPWALTSDGRSDLACAHIEREILGAGVEIRIGAASQGAYPTEGPELLRLVQDADAIAISRVQMSPELLNHVGNRLKVVARQGVGIDNLKPDLLRKYGVIGFNIPDYCVDEVAAHTLALVLSLERHIVAQHQTLVGGNFNIYSGGVPRRLRTLTAGVVGFGRIGKVVAHRFRDFYGRVLACDPNVSDDHIAAYGVERVDFETLLKTCDVVSLHCPLDASTRGMIDDRALRLMKPDCLLINAARGGVVAEQPLRDALREKRLGGAALDVFCPEDPHRNPVYKDILSYPNVVVTCHRAFLSREAEASQRRRVAQGIQQVLQTGSAPVIGGLA